MSLRPRRSLLVPEVIQTSAMDCGPAALAAAAQGLGVRLSYGRLREACQTDVDGTSIDALEDIAKAVGLDAVQSMAPVDHLLLPESGAAPSIVVVVLGSGMTHFVVVWRTHGAWVQVMDPAVGRRWIRRERFLADLYVHEQRLPADMWADWARGEDWRDAVVRRARGIGAGHEALAAWEAAARGDSWKPFARLDAAVRFSEDVVRAGGVARGAAAGRLVASLTGEDGPAIPRESWCVTAAPPRGPADGGGAAPEEIVLRGAVYVRLARAGGASAAPASRSLAAAVGERPLRPWVEALRWTFRGGYVSGAVLALATVCVAAGTVVEGVVLRALLEIGEDLTLVPQRLLALVFLGALLALLLLLETGIASGLQRLGRQLEVRMRAALAEKVPRLSDRYFQTRPVSDLAERGHSLHQMRSLPRLFGELLRASSAIVLTVAALAWLRPDSLPVAAAAGAAALLVPMVFARRLREADLRIRTHTGALGRFYLDALLGLAPLRAHGAERAVRREHESLLVEWSRSTREFVYGVVWLDAAQALVGFTTATLLVVGATGVRSATTVLLLAYWALSLPVLGEEVVRVVRQFPVHRNLLVRLFEILRTPEEPRAGEEQARPVAAGGADLAFDGVRVVAAGHTVLEGLDVRIAPGSRVAVVGASGAGKSTFVGLLLGWHAPAAGRVLVDGEPLDRARLERLRRETVWVDPSVRLWNRSLLENVAYGAEPGAQAAVPSILHDAELRSVADRLPQGLQTALGEGGALLSGGEGQRVRIARGMSRAAPRLVLLDEPFRGLPREQRRTLLDALRRRWPAATFLWITHDVSEAHAMERVLVLDAGRVVEDGRPAELAARPGSAFRALLDAERAVAAGFWDDPAWRRLRLDRGRVTEAGGAA
jgi:ATP-binding cassette subfamily B protein